MLNAQSRMPSKFSYGPRHLKMADIQGSPYLDPEYKIGTILTDKDVVYKNIPLRYNCYFDVLEIRKNNKSYDLIPKTEVKRAEFGGQVFAYKAFESDGHTDYCYFELLAEGKATLCVHVSVKFFDRERLKGFANPKPARFDGLTEIYYISLGNSPAQKILSYKKLINVLSDKKSEVDSFIDKQKLSVNKGEDLKKIVTFYNSL